MCFSRPVFCFRSIIINGEDEGTGSRETEDEKDENCLGSFVNCLYERRDERTQKSTGNILEQFLKRTQTTQIHKKNWEKIWQFRIFFFANFFSRYFFPSSKFWIFYFIFHYFYRDFFFQFFLIFSRFFNQFFFWIFFNNFFSMIFFDDHESFMLGFNSC